MAGLVFPNWNQVCYRIIAMWTGMIERIERAVPSELIKEDIKPGYTDDSISF